jgi:hypothetical protein
MSAAMRLRTREMNQKEFARMSEADGTKAGKGGGGVEGIETWGAMEDSCWEI